MEHTRFRYDEPKHSYSGIQMLSGLHSFESGRKVFSSQRKPSEQAQWSPKTQKAFRSPADVQSTGINPLREDPHDVAVVPIRSGGIGIQMLPGLHSFVPGISPLSSHIKPSEQAQ